MRTSHFLVALGLTASLAAQSPLTTTFNGTSGLSDGGMVFVTLTVVAPAITVYRVDVNSGAASGTQGRVRVWQTIPGVTTWVGSEADITRWTMLAEGDVIASGPGLPTTCCFRTPFTLTNGSFGIAFEHIGIGPRYTPWTSVGMVWGTAELGMQPGVAANNTIYAEPGVAGGDVSQPFASNLVGGGSGRLWNGSIHYTVGTPAPVCSSTQRAALACGGGFASWFRVEATPARANASLQGKTLRMVPNANGAYDVQTLPAQPTIPYATHTALGGFSTSIAGAIATDDGEATTPPLVPPFAFPGGTATSFVVTTNGVISTASNLAWFDTFLGDDWSPQIDAVRNAPNATWCVWHDFDLTNVGAIRFDDDGVRIVITWDAVPSTFGPLGNTSTIQAVFDRSSGAVSFTFLAINTIGISPSSYQGNPYLVGWSPAGPSVKPRYPIDTALFATQFGDAADAAHAALTSTPRPVVGSVVEWSVTGLQAAAPVGLLYFSVTNPFFPGLPLQTLGVGRPGCLLNVDLANAIGPFLFSAPGQVLSVSTGTVTPSMLGLDCWSQALVFDALAPNLFDSLVSTNALQQFFTID